MERLEPASRLLGDVPKMIEKFEKEYRVGSVFNHSSVMKHIESAVFQSKKSKGGTPSTLPS